MSHAIDPRLARAIARFDEHRELQAKHDRYLEALRKITQQPRGHDCYGYCHRMKTIALDALVGGDPDQGLDEEAITGMRVGGDPE